MRRALAVLVFLPVLAGCFGPAYDASKAPVIGPGATMGACDGLLAAEAPPAAVVRLEEFGDGEQVQATLDRAPLGEHDVDAAGCAAVPFAGDGVYRFVGWGSCTQQAESEWDGSAHLEVYIPHDEGACV